MKTYATMKAKRLHIRLGDIIALAAITLVLNLGFALPAHAYVDPSVMTYTIQALAGVAVALSTVIGVVWRRLRRKVYKTFNIDENKGKLVEPDVKAISPDLAIKASEAAMAPGSFGAKAHEDSDLKYKPAKWHKRILPAALISTFTTATLLLVAPYELVAANSDSLLFGLEDIWAPVAIATLVVDAIVFAILLAFRGKAFKIACSLVFAFGACCYLQALFMNFALPAANGYPVDWGEYTTVTVESALMWVAVFAIVIAFGARSSWKAQRIVPLAAAALIFVQGAGVASLFMDDPTKSIAQQSEEQAIAESIVTDDGLYDLDPNSNVVVFVLDTIDTTLLMPLMDSNPEYFEGMTDFTFFNDVSGSMVPTRYGAGFLYTGVMPSKDEPFQTWWDERYDRSSFVKDIKAQGYSVDIYTDSLFNGVQELDEYVDNIHPLTEAAQLDSPESVVLMLWKCAMYRDMTWALKAPFWFYTEEVNDSMTSKEKGWEQSSPYRMNDSLYYADLKERGLTLSDTGSNGAFKFIHLLGSHWPYVLDENAQATPLNESDIDRQTLGSFKIVGDYIQDMKDLGVYDSSTIIVTSDHGIFDYGPELEELDRPTSPIMFVKPANPENPGQPLATSEVPITHAHFHPTVIEAVGGDWQAYGTPALKETPNDDTRYYYMTVHDGKVDHSVKEYAIDGDVKDLSNWELTSFEWKLNTTW